MTSATKVNEEQREYWTGSGAADWERCGDWWETLFAPFGQAMLDAADLGPGKRVLDVGCGFGATTVAAARRVGPEGEALGVDISPVLLATAQERAAGVDNVRWQAADAQTHPFEPASNDVIISRFAMMLFDDPAAAFANLRRALRPGGRMAFVCWQDPMQVEWIATAVPVAVSLLGHPPDLGEPGAPGPFAFADGDRVQRLVTDGGFAEVTVTPVTRPQRVGTDLDDAVRSVLDIPESREMFAEASEETLAAASDALRTAFKPYAGPHGVVTDATAWLVTARRQPE